MLELMKGGFWFGEWVKLGQRVGVDMEALSRNMNEDVWKGRIECLMERMYEAKRNEWIMRARESTHELYGKLDYEKGLTYVTDKCSMNVIKWVMRARVGMVGLNSCPWRDVGRRLCTMCNRKEEEDFVHFLGVCPILRHTRMKFLGMTELTENQCVNVLNGEWMGSWVNLAGYLKEAWNLRQIMVHEFNS